MKSRNATALMIGGVLSIAVSIASANASTLTFDWSLTGPAAGLGGVTAQGSGTLTVTTGIGGDDITAITGTLGGDIITGLAATGTLNSNDNLLFPIGTTFTGPPVVMGTKSYVSASDLDIHGLAVITAEGTFDIYGFYQPNSTDVTAGNNYGELGPTGFGVGTFAVSPTPLPAGLPLFATGLGVIGLLGWRRKRKAAAIAA